MVDCGSAYDSHPWARDGTGRRVCEACDLVDLTAARLDREVIAAAVRAGLLKPLEEHPP